MTAIATSALKPAAEWPVVIVASSLGLSALLLAVVVAAVVRKTGGAWLGHPAPSPKWSFESWALHLAAVGGVLGTVLGSITLPEAPAQIDKESVVALSVLFGALVVVAPFISEAIRRWPKPAAPGAEEAGTGYVAVLLLACAIVFAGAFGELLTLGLVSWELTGGNAGGIATEAGLGMLSVLAFYYVAVTAWEAATIDWTAPADSASQAPRGAAVESLAAPEDAHRLRPPRRSTWSLP